MKTINFDASYHALLDMLYAGDVSSPCDKIEDTPSGMTVMYSSDGTPIGVEISQFSKRDSDDVIVDAKSPFILKAKITLTYPHANDRKAYMQA